jgi:hypothetical protein
MIKDGRRWSKERRNGPRLYFGDGSLNFLNNPFSAYIVEGDWGLAWLRENPDLDIEASTIRAPKRSGAPPPASTLSEITRETMRQLGGLTGRDPVVRSAPEWAVTPLRIDADDFFRSLESFRRSEEKALSKSATEAQEPESSRLGQHPQRREDKPPRIKFDDIVKCARQVADELNETGRSWQNIDDDLLPLVKKQLPHARRDDIRAAFREKDIRAAIQKTRRK